MKDSATLAILKISDRKLSAICKVVLTEMCTVCSPHSVLEAVIESVADVRSPIAHEEVLTWFKSFCEDFGVNSLGSSITSIIPWVLNVSTKTYHRNFIVFVLCKADICMVDRN